MKTSAPKQKQGFIWLGKIVLTFILVVSGGVWLAGTFAKRDLKVKREQKSGDTFVNLVIRIA